MSSLTLYDGGSALSSAIRLAELPEPDLKRTAAAACRDRDTGTLIDILCAYIRLRGKSGAHVSQHTIGSYSTSARILIASWASESLMSPRRDAGAVFVRRLEAEGKSPGTVTVRLAGARTLYAALRWTGCTDADPFRDVRAARDKRASHEKRAAYEDSAVDRLLAVAGPHETVLVLLGAHTGLRNFEICKLRWQDIDLQRRTLFTIGKGNKPATVNVSRTLCDALDALPRDGEYVFPFRSTETARAWMKRLCKRAGQDYRAVHSLRHTAGSRLMRESRDITQVASHLRHSSIEVTRGYLHRIDDTVKKSVGDW